MSADKNGRINRSIHCLNCQHHRVQMRLSVRVQLGVQTNVALPHFLQSLNAALIQCLHVLVRVKDDGLMVSIEQFKVSLRCLDGLLDETYVGQFWEVLVIVLFAMSVENLQRQHIGVLFN